MALFRALTEQSLEFVSILDADGRFTYVSPSVKRILGYAASDLIGTKPVELVHPDDRSVMLATYFTLVDGPPGTASEMMVRLRHRNGSWHYFEGGGQNLLHVPAVRGITSNARDVTERVEAERAHHASDALFRQFVEMAHGGVIATDDDGFITYANAHLGALLGYTQQELLGKRVFDLMSPVEAEVAQRRFALRRLGESDQVESELIARDGHRVAVLLAVSPIFGENEAFAGALAFVTDITDRKRSETKMADALRDADLDRRRLEATLDALPVGVWLADASGALTHTNPAAERIWGGAAPLVSAKEDYGSYLAWWPDTGLPIAPDEWALARTLKTGETVTNELVEVRRFDDSRGFLLNSTGAIRDVDGQLIGGVVVNVDISEHQAALSEKETLAISLGNEQSRLTAIFQDSPAFLAVLRGPDLVYERVNPAYLTLIGRRDVLGRRIREAVPELEAQGFLNLIEKVISTGESFFGRRMPVRLCRVASEPLETRYVDIAYHRLVVGGGEPSVAVHGVDVTEEVLANKALLLSDERLRGQFAKLPVPTYLWEAIGSDFKLLDCNEAAASIDPEFARTARGLTRSVLFGGVDDLGLDFRRCLRDDVVIHTTAEFDCPAPLGRRFFDLTIGPQQPDRVIVHAVDSTAHNELEAQLRQSQKMEAVGRLAGGVAHDFNNLLTVIGGHTGFLLGALDPADPRHADAEAIQKATVRAAGLTSQLLAFSRKQIMKPTQVSLNAIVDDTRMLLARLLGEDIQIATTLAGDLGTVFADAAQIGQVLLNLAVNARDAMPSGGQLVIATRNATLSQDQRGSRAMIPAGRYALLEVRDTGEGMSAEIQSRLFEPFFTTKPVGKGTGLGLATVYGIVKQSAGFIAHQSAPAEGTTFQIYLPLVFGEMDAAIRELLQKPADNGTETVLLIEDESAVRAIAKRLLTSHGYIVLEAADGAEALGISASFRSKIDLVISDAVMPGMGGAQVVRLLEEQRPGIKSLFMSGYTDDEVVRGGIVSSAVHFVQKPFTEADFTRAVRGTLDA
ncbi:MAG: PAS domain S-box protein [Gemmatimonadota bacterium]|nr:PAS domain S-box protein [Gemmatimonadota bacterium]